MPTRPINVPNWMDDIDIDTLMRINEIANRLIDEGYSEEQAYMIALELGEEWEQDENEGKGQGLPDEL